MSRVAGFASPKVMTFNAWQLAKLLGWLFIFVKDVRVTQVFRAGSSQVLAGQRPVSPEVAVLLFRREVPLLWRCEQWVNSLAQPLDLMSCSASRSL